MSAYGRGKFTAIKERDIPHLVAAISYIALSFLSFYCACYRLPVGVKYCVNLTVALWAGVAYWIAPRKANMRFCMRFLLMYFAAFALAWAASLGMWVLRLEPLQYVTRGSQNIAYMLTNIAYVCAAFYLFDMRSVKYTFFAMALANTAVLLRVAGIYGASEIFREYTVLLTSFANETGHVMQRLEMHDMVFGWGAYALYFLMQREDKGKARLLYLAVALFYFTLSMKRIAVAALIAAACGAVLYMRMREAGRKYMLTALFTLACMGGYAYIALIYDGGFFQRAKAWGVNLMGRQTIYEAYKPFYTLSPFYMGRGIRFVYEYGQINGGFSSLHNVYLELFIELGFFVWTAWLFIEIYARGRFVMKRYGSRACVYLFAGMVYILTTYATDNTLFQFPVNVVYRLLAMCWCRDACVRRQNAKDGEMARGERSNCHNTNADI